MASITIRNIPDQTKDILRVQAAQSGVSLEAYVRRILVEVSQPENSHSKDLAQLAQHYFGNKHGVDLELPERGSHRPFPEMK